MTPGEFLEVLAKEIQWGEKENEPVQQMSVETRVHTGNERTMQTQKGLAAAHPEENAEAQTADTIILNLIDDLRKESKWITEMFQGSCSEPRAREIKLEMDLAARILEIQKQEADARIDLDRLTANQIETAAEHIK